MDLPYLKEEIEKIDNNDVWSLYAFLIFLLKKRGLIRTKNIVGERGEFLTIEIYNKTPKLPNLQAAPEGTQNVDALSRKGDRYSIKTITLPGKTTGVFYGISSIEEKKFEYVVIVVIDENYNLVKMIELSWEQFFECKKWHKRMTAWNLSITKKLLNTAKIIF